MAMCGTTNKDNKQRQQTKATDKGNKKDNTKDNTNGKQLKAANVATRKGQFQRTTEIEGSFYLAYFKDDCLDCCCFLVMNRLPGLIFHTNMRMLMKMMAITMTMLMTTMMRGPGEALE